MRIGIFSKFECSGGSEFRCVELANGISAVDGHHGVLFAERGIPGRVLAAVRPGVEVHQGVFSNGGPDSLYSVDRLLVVNTDSKEFTTADYWHGKTPRHGFHVDLKRLGSMTFLFNFIVSPARHLTSIEEHLEDVRVIAGNTKFFQEIGEQDRYELVRHYPRLRLESPIDPNSVTAEKIPSARLRFGMHSKPLGSKWNSEFEDLIQTVNRNHSERVSWEFMGMADSLAERLRAIQNVRIRGEFSVPVRDFLREVDVFVYFLSWDREEPWSRSAAEALASGCPVVTTAKGGNLDQIMHGNNGFLCKTTDDFVTYCLLVVEHCRRCKALHRNAIACARQFTTDRVARRLLEFLQ